MICTPVLLFLFYKVFAVCYMICCLNERANAVGRNADELSDLSENDADSDVTLDETPTEYEDEASDDVSDDDVGLSEQYDDEEGFFNREGHFVVPERVRPAVVGHATRTRVSAQTSAKPARRTSKQTAELSVQTDVDSRLASAAAPTSTRRKNTKRKLSSQAAAAIVTSSASSSDEELDGAIGDPVFVVKPQRVTSVMEGANAEWKVSLKSPTPVGEFSRSLIIPNVDLPKITIKIDL